MARAFSESARVLVPAGLLIIVEPCARGPFYEALKVIDDESEIMALARDSIQQGVADGRFRLLETRSYIRQEVFGSVDQFLARVIAVDSARLLATVNKRVEVDTAFANAATTLKDGGFELKQPIKADVLKRC